MEDSPVDDLMELASNLVVEKYGSDGSLSDEVLGKMTADIHSRLEDVIEDTMVQAIPASRLAEFESLIDRDADEDAMAAFFNKHVPDLDDRIAEALREFGEKFTAS